MEEETIDLKSLWGVFVSHIKLVIIFTLAGLIAAAVVTGLLITPKYNSSAQIYVENRSATSSSSSDSININDINAAQKLVATCEILFKNSNVLETVRNNLELDYSNTQLSKMISIASVSSTEIMKISTVSASPEEAYNITKEIVEVIPDEFYRVIEAGSIKLVEEANFPRSPSSPSMAKNVAIGGLAGFVIACAVIFLKEFLDTTVKPDDDIFKIYDIPVFAEIMDFDAVSSNDGYGYGEKSTKGAKEG